MILCICIISFQHYGVTCLCCITCCDPNYNLSLEEQDFNPHVVSSESCKTQLCLMWVRAEVKYSCLLAVKCCNVLEQSSLNSGQVHRSPWKENGTAGAQTPHTGENPFLLNADGSRDRTHCYQSRKLCHLYIQLF